MCGEFLCFLCPSMLVCVHACVSMREHVKGATPTRREDNVVIPSLCWLITGVN